jgi:stress response protein YsnF
VVEKRVVPQERVRLGKETIAEEREVSEEVRKEQIETEGTDRAGRDRQTGGRTER